VKVYRLISRHTVEEKLVENGYKKMALGQLFIKPVN